MFKLYTRLFTLCLASGLALSAGAQSIVVPAELDDLGGGFRATYLNLFVNADTMPDGSQAHDVYLLEAGATYFWTARETWGFPTMFRATGDVESLGRPFLGRVSLTGGTPSDMYRGTASIGFDGIEFEMGEEGIATAASYEVASIRPQASADNEPYTVTFNNCILYKSRQALARCDRPNVSAFVTNCHIYNLGDYGMLQGNGRVIDVRNGPADSIVIKNNYIHNILDRIYIGFRQASANYVNISENTIFNHAGRHGFIQLTNTKESVIRDNLFINPCIMGSSPIRANEQGEREGRFEEFYVISLDTVVDGGSADIRNNNIHYTQDVLNFYNEFDTVFKPKVISPTLLGLVGDTSNSFMYMPVELNNVPSRTPIIQYARDTYNDPSGAATDIMVEDSTFITFQPDFDNGNNFNFLRFDPCYDSSSPLATAGTNGGSIGATWACSELSVSTRSPAGYNSAIGLSAVPNPASNDVRFDFNLPATSDVVITVHSMDAKEALVAFTGTLGEGGHRVSWDGVGTLTSGMHIVQIQTNVGRMIRKLIVE